MPPQQQFDNPNPNRGFSLVALLILLSSVPLQYYLIKTDGGAKGSLSKVSRMLAGWYDWYNRMEEWLDDVLPPADIDALADFDDYDGEDGEGGGGPVQLQIDLGDGLTMTNLTEEWFASSKRARRTRPDAVLFKVGEVIYHNLFYFHCVIIGWDKVLKAPDVWIELVYGEDYEDYLDEPHYSLVCDMRETESLQEEFQYCAQRELEDPPAEEDYVQLSNSEWVNRRRLVSTYLDSFFEGFDEASGRYTMRPWLRRQYPRD